MTVKNKWMKLYNLIEEREAACGGTEWDIAQAEIRRLLSSSIVLQRMVLSCARKCSEALDEKRHSKPREGYSFPHTFSASPRCQHRNSAGHRCNTMLKNHGEGKFHEFVPA